RGGAAPGRDERSESAAVLRARVGVGEGVRDGRGWPAFALGARGGGRRPRPVLRRPRARLASGGDPRGAAWRTQPVSDLVLAGGAGVHAVRVPVRPVVAVLLQGAVSRGAS